MSNGNISEGKSQRRELFCVDDFAYALAKMVATQICESAEINNYRGSQVVRFNSCQESALETLTGVAIRYIQSVGKAAKFYANVAGRVECNAMDIVQALEDMGFGLGFDGGPDIDHCLAYSGVVKDLIRYTGETEETPFVYSLPRFPFNNGKIPSASFSVIGAEPPDMHIPDWLPAFPETKMSNGAEENSVENIGDVKTREKETSFSCMQEVIDVNRLKIQKPIEEFEGNPFLASPIWVGEKNMLRVFYLSEHRNEEVGVNHASEKHMSKIHRISTPKEYAERDDGEEKDGARTQRASLRFKIRTRKAYVLHRSLEGKGWFQEDGDKMEKKVECKRKASKYSHTHTFKIGIFCHLQNLYIRNLVIVCNLNT